jgi:hypothetical protein
MVQHYLYDLQNYLLVLALGGLIPEDSNAQGSMALYQQQSEFPFYNMHLLYKSVAQLHPQV